MTTLGVNPWQPWRVDGLQDFPSYNYHYPHFKRRQLCDRYYECTRIPSPIIRRRDMNRLRQECEDYKLEIAAAPGTTNMEQGRRQNVKFPAVIPARTPDDISVRARIPPKEYAKWRHETAPVVTTQTRAGWNHFLSRCPERFDIEVPLESPGNGTTPYYDGGYALRFLRPHLTRGLGVERWVDRPFGVKPSPAEPSPHRDIKVHNALAGK